MQNYKNGWHSTPHPPAEPIPHIGCFDLDFSESDVHDEIHGMVSIPLDMERKVVYMDLKINGGELIRFWFNYQDPGTVFHARMDGSYAVSGLLSNVTMNWAEPLDTDIYRLIHAVGTWKRATGKAKLWLWMKKPKK